MELTSLIWADKVEYRDIYDSEGKLVRYFKINNMIEMWNICK